MDYAVTMKVIPRNRRNVPATRSVEPTDHLAVDDVAGRTAGRVCALAGQHLEIVPMIGGSAALRGSNDRDSQA